MANARFNIYIYIYIYLYWALVKAIICFFLKTRPSYVQSRNIMFTILLKKRS